jgi:tRNA(Ser,Leu) C12 N-acetylase TAN1
MSKQKSEIISNLKRIAVHINDRNNHSNLPPVAMGWCEEAIDLINKPTQVSVEEIEEILRSKIDCEYHHREQIKETAQALYERIYGKEIPCKS